MVDNFMFYIVTCKPRCRVVGAFSGGLLGVRLFGPPGLLIGALIGAIGAFAVQRE